MVPTQPGARLEISTQARRRIALRLLPFIFVLYIDRVNVSFASLRMNTDLNFTDAAFGLGSGIFYLGYVLFEIPGALIVERWSARKWMGRIMISWGIITVLTVFPAGSQARYRRSLCSQTGRLFSRCTASRLGAGCALVLARGMALALCSRRIY